MKEANFGWALLRLKEGKRVYRDGWGEPGMWLQIQVPDGHKKTKPYIYIKTARDVFIPWRCSRADMLAIDWVVLYMW